MANPYLLLWLEGPLQAWGHDSRFGRRDSLDFPTKSGVLGLLCCARGAGGPQSEWLAAWADLDMQVEGYVPRDEKGRPLARLPLLRDFHMVGNGYDDGDPWQTLLIPKKRDGSKAVGGGAKLTFRYYVQDMAYAVAIQAPASLFEETVAALQMPVWDLYLGRKNCAPTEFIYQGLFDSAEAALRAGADLAEKKNRWLALRVLQGEHEGEVVVLNDVPVRFGPVKSYRNRRVTVQRPEMPMLSRAQQ
ncbi:type I-E CRISPR-associated protein Cas5/CasD [uncultured Pigmentiphaga sp.]|uniref:type I-E CRISPR-associated protein Cas5/CasD n=1 Tax=uncultured Pigmentiphaga sp. TaxID=340361 RepID=UPI00260EE8E1|nr:type I-E CRISPR-associated protein Cas5/CasD [uncultured Pigmentiphaga sp.]